MPEIKLDLNELLSVGYDGDGEPIGRSLRDHIAHLAADKLAQEYREDAGQRIREAVQKVVNDEVRDIVREALAKPIQRTTRWGEHEGKPTTVLEIARERLEAFLNAKSYRDSYNKDPQNLADLINDAVKAALREELRPAVAEARQAVAVRLRDALITSVSADVAKAR